MIALGNLNFHFLLEWTKQARKFVELQRWWIFFLKGLLLFANLEENRVSLVVLKDMDSCAYQKFLFFPLGDTLSLV